MQLESFDRGVLGGDVAVLFLACGDSDESNNSNENADRLTHGDQA
jgi:hypothetical protein